jgi:uncharacterized membrane protein HdeD (DUF308 family)
MSNDTHHFFKLFLLEFLLVSIYFLLNFFFSNSNAYLFLFVTFAFFDFFYVVSKYRLRIVMGIVRREPTFP